MIRYISFLLLFVGFKAYQQEKFFDESPYIINKSFPSGDARRYGLTADSANLKHPYSKKNRLLTVLDIAEKSGLEIEFPKGYYGADLILDSRKNLKLKFNKSEFNFVHITQPTKQDKTPENIKLKCTLIIYARLGITEAKNIEIDSVLLKTDTSKNLWGMRNTGCHIYHGNNNVSINYLLVEDVGSGNEKYKYAHAALALDGWNNNPKNIKIKKVHIKSSDRHGLYMTRTGHYIKDLIIDQFGVGSSDFIVPMQDAKIGEEKEFTAVWSNKAYNCIIDKVTINEKSSSGNFSLYFDEGNKLFPNILGEVNILNSNPKIVIKKSANTAVKALISIDFMDE